MKETTPDPNTATPKEQPGTGTAPQTGQPDETQTPNMRPRERSTGFDTSNSTGKNEKTPDEWDVNKQ
jgi:hypothetical protein